MIPDIHKTVIVTGTLQGIGAGLVKAFLDRRYNAVAYLCLVDMAVDLSRGKRSLVRVFALLINK